VPSERDRNQEGMSLTKSTWNFIAHSALGVPRCTHR